MKTITVAELRQNPTDALAEVESGETYVVTRHRRPIARLVPMQEGHLELPPPRNPDAPRPAFWNDGQLRTPEEIDALLAEMRENR